MGGRLGTSIAPAQAHSTRGSKIAGAGHGSEKNVNSDSRAPFDPSQKQGRGKKAAARAAIEFPDDWEEGDEDPKKRIERLALARYQQSASIDAAIAMAYAGKVVVLTGAALEAKQRVAYSDDLWEEILIRVAEGESVVTICEDAHMPVRTAIYKWMRKDPEMDRQYQNAVLLKADKCVEQAKDLAMHMKQRAEMGATNEEITALKTAINTLQWTAARLNPAKYGDKQSIDLDARVKVTEAQADTRLAALIAKMSRKPGSSDDGDGSSDAGAGQA